MEGRVYLWVFQVWKLTRDRGSQRYFGPSSWRWWRWPLFYQLLWRKQPQLSQIRSTRKHVFKCYDFVLRPSSIRQWLDILGNGPVRVSCRTNSQTQRYLKWRGSCWAGHLEEEGMFFSSEWLVTRVLGTKKIIHFLEEYLKAERLLFSRVIGGCYGISSCIEHKTMYSKNTISSTLSQRRW